MSRYLIILSDAFDELKSNIFLEAEMEFLNSSVDYPALENYLTALDEIDVYFSLNYGDQYSRDGIVQYKGDQEALLRFFDKKRLRIVLLLKEARNGNNWEARYAGTIRKDADNPSPIWAYYIIRTIDCMQKNVTYDKDCNFFQHGGVNSFAYINIKKQGEDLKKTPKSRLMKYASRDRQPLKRQIMSCKPDIVFCCGAGVFDACKVIFEPFSECLTPIRLLDDRKAFIHRLNVEDQSFLLVENYLHPSQNNWGYARQNIALCAIKEFIGLMLHSPCN